MVAWVIFLRQDPRVNLRKQSPSYLRADLENVWDKTPYEVFEELTGINQKTLLGYALMT